MNNTSATEVGRELGKDFELRNVFTDYTAGTNLSEYHTLMNSRNSTNGTVQWVLRLRQKFEDHLKKHAKNRDLTTASSASKTKISVFGNAPS